MTSPDIPSEAGVRAVLATILDPEMPVNLVDLGLIERVTIVPTGPNADAAAAAVRIDVLPTFVGCPALDMIRDLIRARVGELRGVAAVEVRFLNDPPWSTDRITSAGRESLRRHDVTVPSPRPASGPAFVQLNRPLDPGARPTGEDKAPAGDACGHDSGSQGSADDAVACPFCASLDTRLESRFGPTRCRMIYYCPACKNSFEHLKHL